MKIKSFCAVSVLTNKTFIFYLIAIILLFPEQGSALTFCRCREIGSVIGEKERSDAVFSGVVEDIRWNGGDNERIIFTIEKIWKGLEPERKEIQIFTDRPSLVEKFTDKNLGCGFLFEEGEKYLVYTYVEKASPHRVSRCSRTKKLEEAEEDIKILNEGLGIRP